MNKNESRALIDHISSLYPRANDGWSPAIQHAFADQLSPIALTFDQAKAAVNDERMNRAKYANPDTGAILKRLREVAGGRADPSKRQARELDIWRARIEATGVHGLTDREVVERHVWADHEHTYNVAFKARDQNWVDSVLYAYRFARDQALAMHGVS